MKVKTINITTVEDLIINVLNTPKAVLEVLDIYYNTKSLDENPTMISNAYLPNTILVQFTFKKDLITKYIVNEFKNVFQKVMNEQRVQKTLKEIKGE